VYIIVADFNLLRPSGFFTYKQVEHSKIIRDARFATFALHIITVVESVCCSVQKANYVWFLQG